ncbi:hypothetical protein, partial [Streptomyces sp. HPF1205]|uniref:hypothetical protein n=1 Tax=Streptomyces sp. HPF1205 TaxID=2873262 RepID=UPI001CEC8327
GASSVLSGTWLLLRADANGEGTGADVAEAVRAAGAHVVDVSLGADADRSDVADAVRVAVAGLADGGAVSGVLVLPVRDGGVAPDAGVLGFALAAVQGVGDAECGGRVWVVTRGAVSTGRSDTLESPAGGLLWGLSRVAALELPDSWGGVVDLPGVVDVRAG